MTLQTNIEESLEGEKQSLSYRIARIAADLARQAGPNGKLLSKEEIDALWGHTVSG